MKKTLLVTAIASALFAGCNHAEEKKTTEENTTSNDSLIQETEITTIAVEENASDVHFIKALTSFQEKNNEASAMHIEQGIEAYKIETANAKGKVKATAETNEAALKVLAEKVKKGEVKDEAELEKEFYKSEQIVAHTVIYSVEDIALIPDSVSKSPSYFAKALSHFKAVVNKEKGNTKKAGEEIVAKGEEIESKLKRNEKVADHDIKEFYMKSKKWLEAHI